jgi:hypothetical protein
MPINQLTAKQTIRELARMVGDLLVEGTATAGSGTTLVDTKNLLFATDDDIKGDWLAIDAGAAIGDERPISSFTASSDTATVVDGFSATPDTTSTYIVTRRWRPQLYLDAVAAAVRRAQHFQLFPLDDIAGHQNELITMGDILSTDGNGNGQMENFTSGVPDGWTEKANTTSASDSDTDDARRGTTSYKCTSDGSNLAGIKQAIKYFERYAGTTVDFKAHIRADTDARLLIRVDDGPSTAVTDTGADGANVWEELTASLTIAANPTGIDVDCEISAGGAVIGNFDDVRLIWQGGTIYEYDLPSRLVYLSKVETEIGSNVSGSTSPNVWVDVPRNAWKVQRGTNPKLVFIPERYTPGKDVHVRITGQAHPATLTSATPATMWAETVEAPAEFVKAYAKWYLLNSLPSAQVNETDRRERVDAQKAWMEMEETFGAINPVNPGSELVRVG